MPGLTALADLDDDALAGYYRPGGANWLRVNFVTSLDGAVSVEGYSRGLSGAADKRVFAILRMCCDALLVGAGTLRHEGYREIRLDEPRRVWRRRHGLVEYPTLVVVSRRLALSPDNPALADAPVRPIILTARSAPPDRRRGLGKVADVLVCGDDEVDFGIALAALRDRGLRQVLSEGGPHVLGSLTAADLVDELDLTLSPMLVGPGAGRITAGAIQIPEPVRGMRLRHILHGDGSLMLRYDRTR